MRHTHVCPICSKKVKCNAEGYTDMHQIGHDECLAKVIGDEHDY